jgi:hypothetical protein
VRARFHRDGGSWETLRQRGEALARVGDRFFGDDFSRCIEDAHRVPAVPEIESYRNFTFVFGYVHKAGFDRSLPRFVQPAFSFLLVSPFFEPLEMVD